MVSPLGGFWDLESEIEPTISTLRQNQATLSSSDSSILKPQFKFLQSSTELLLYRLRADLPGGFQHFSWRRILHGL